MEKYKVVRQPILTKSVRSIIENPHVLSRVKLVSISHVTEDARNVQFKLLLPQRNVSLVSLVSLVSKIVCHSSKVNSVLVLYGLRNVEKLTISQLAVW